MASRIVHPWLGRGLIVAGAGMIPWLAGLAVQLPSQTTAYHWAAAWTGLDAMEAAGLAATGLLLLRRDDRYRLTAMVTATLLVVDAWFDVTTSAPGGDQAIAIAMAVCAELPVAALCAVLAWRGDRTRVQAPAQVQAPVQYRPLATVGSPPCESLSSALAAENTPYAGPWPRIPRSRACTRHQAIPASASSPSCTRWPRPTRWRSPSLPSLWAPTWSSSARKPRWWRARAMLCVLRASPASAPTPPRR
jgi:hypothetical protein